MNKLCGFISLAAAIASTHSQVAITDAAETPRMHAQQPRLGQSDTPKNVLTDATALVNKNNAVNDNNIAVSDSNVLLTQNDRFKVDKQAGTVHVRGARENDEDPNQEQMWTGGFGYPYYRYNYRYRYWW